MFNLIAYKKATRTIYFLVVYIYYMSIVNLFPSLTRYVNINNVLFLSNFVYFIYLLHLAQEILVRDFEDRNNSLNNIWKSEQYLKSEADTKLHYLSMNSAFMCWQRICYVVAASQALSNKQRFYDCICPLWFNIFSLIINLALHNCI